jgi:hypothetical protein
MRTPPGADNLRLSFRRKTPILPPRMEDFVQPPQKQRRHLWPWFAAIGVVAALVLAVVWVRAEIQRVKEQRQPQMPASGK